jgi:hypothetical protein
MRENDIKIVRTSKAVQASSKSISADKKVWLSRVFSEGGCTNLAALKVGGVPRNRDRIAIKLPDFGGRVI